MGIIEEQLLKKNEYRKELERLVKSKPSIYARLLIVLLYKYERISGVKCNTEGFSLFFYVVEKIKKILDLIKKTNPRYVRLQNENKQVITDQMPQWSGAELYRVLKELQHDDGREITANFSSKAGKPFILDSYDADDVEGFVEGLKGIDSDTLKQFMSTTNIYYKTEPLMSALDEIDNNMINYLISGEENILVTDPGTVYDDVLMPLLYQSGSLSIGDTHPVAEKLKQIIQNTNNISDVEGVLPMEKAVAALEYYLREYYYNIDILLPEEKEAIEKVLSKEKYKEQVAPIVEKCLLEHEHQGMATATTHKTLVQGSAKYSEKLKSEEAQKMFERFIDEGYIVQREDGFYNWQKTQALCVYFAESASEHLGLDSLKAGKKHSSWKPFENVFFFVDAGTNEWTKQHHNFSSVIQNQPKPEGAETIDEIFKTLK